jgi:hypothetical protein
MLANKNGCQGYGSLVSGSLVHGIMAYGTVANGRMVYGGQGLWKG